MFDLRATAPTTSTTFTADTSLAAETIGGPAREWADALILEIVMEGPQDRNAFVRPRGALAARLVSLDASAE